MIALNTKILFFQEVSTFSYVKNFVQKVYFYDCFKIKRFFFQEKCF
jgi:hypothetical protein